MPCHEDPCPARTKVQELIKHEACPDPDARIVVKGKEKVLPPGRTFYRVTQLLGGTTEAVVGVKVVHRRPTGLQEIHVHTTRPSEVLKYLAVALIG